MSRNDKIEELLDKNLEINKFIYEKIQSGHLDDKPSSETKIELESIKKDIKTISIFTERIEKKVDDFISSADKKYAKKEIVDLDISNLKEDIKKTNERIDKHDSIFSKLTWFIVLAVLGAVLALVGLKF